MNVVCIVGRLNHQPKMSVAKNNSGYIRLFLTVKSRIKFGKSQKIPVFIFNPLAGKIFPFLIKGKDYSVVGSIANVKAEAYNKVAPIIIKVMSISIVGYSTDGVPPTKQDTSIPVTTEDPTEEDFDVPF